MVRMAAEHGTTALVATPHANLTYCYQPDQIAQRLAQVEAAAGGALRLCAGCDFHLSFDNIQDALANPRKYTINRGNCLLVEFSDLMISRSTEEIFGHLLAAGMTPIVTHPERNDLLRQRIDELARWVECGVCVQVTAQSFTGGFGRKAQDFSISLLERGLVHFIASDAHDCEHRPPRMDLAYAWIKERYGESVAQALCVRNPAAALEGESIQPVTLEAASSPRKWYHIWR